MNLNLDEPIKFDKTECELCGRSDGSWFLMQLLGDGDWRKLMPGTSLRAYGLDEQDTQRGVYAIHACSESIVRTFRTDKEVMVFQMSLRERRKDRETVETDE